jgi:hypothetical protein
MLWTFLASKRVIVVQQIRDAMMTKVQKVLSHLPDAS